MTLRRLRRWLASALAGALLLVQAAAAAYACPLFGQNEAARTSIEHPCAEMQSRGVVDDDALSGLCVEHCKSEGQSLEPASQAIPYLPALPATFSPPLAAMDPGPRWTPTEPRRDRGPPLPHSIEHCCRRL